MPRVIINRSKLVPAPGRAYRFAWKWLYTVAVPGMDPMSGESLAWARRIAHKYANGLEIVEAWQVAA